MWNEFKTFAFKGNAFDLAVGVIIGAAFSKIVDGIVTLLITPVIGAVLGGLSFDDYFLPLSSNITATTLAQAQQQVLREWEDMTHGWFARRHSGAQAALEAAREIARCNDATEAMGAYQRWLAGSVSRVAADALDAQSHGARMMKACADALRTNGEVQPGAAVKRGEGGVEPRSPRRSA